MKLKNPDRFNSELLKKNKHFPLEGHLELTYRCDSRCVYCYCRSRRDDRRESSTLQWKKILDEVCQAGCFFLTFSGGNPFIRKDFLEIYDHARKKGFVINVITSGLGLSREIGDHLSRFPPKKIEVNFNGATRKTFESINGTPGSYDEVIKNIRLLTSKNIRVDFKTRLIRQNKNELGAIKKLAGELLGPQAGKRPFWRYSHFIHPGMDGDKTPCSCRLSAAEVRAARKQDPELWTSYRRSLQGKISVLKDKSRLFTCNAWRHRFVIDPYGRLKFCVFLDRFSTDLKTGSFEKGFYQGFSRIARQKYESASACRDCLLRDFCAVCPARSFLETGDEEAPVPYYCEMARSLARDYCRIHPDYRERSSGS
jgi:radical SAM protein with 4Fe4S-binding SPASM domain